MRASTSSATSLAKRLANYCIWPILFIGQLLTVSLLSWHLLAQVDFAYPIGYKLLDLDKHIAEFAPLNRYKYGFEFTTPRDHWKLFSQICDAVQHNGKGLTEISYTLPNDIHIPLMHSAEIIHLTDVSHLINKFYWAGGIGALMWIICLYIVYRQKLVFPSSRSILIGFCSGIFIVTSIVLSIGATKVFYWFHTKVFPDGHQWFFYYEDSLMTTLMKAPDIFAFIASLLLVVLIIFWVLSTFSMARLLNSPLRNESLHKPKTIKAKNKPRKNKK